MHCTKKKLPPSSPVCIFPKGTCKKSNLLSAAATAAVAAITVAVAAITVAATASATTFFLPHFDPFWHFLSLFFAAATAAAAAAGIEEGKKFLQVKSKSYSIQLPIFFECF